MDNIKSLKKRGLDFVIIANNYDVHSREIKCLYVDAIRDAYRKNKGKNFNVILQEFGLHENEYKSLMMEYITGKLIKSIPKPAG